MPTSSHADEPQSSIGRPRLWYPRVPSTMDVAAALAARGAPHGTVVIAEHQTAGRGRQGRSWTAAPGSALLTSWILRYAAPLADASALSPLVALAVIRAIQRVAPDAPTAFKWPNDVLMDGRKVAGILLTSRASPPGGVVTVGIGLNLRPDAVPDDADGASLAEWWPDVTTDRMLNAIAESLEPVWQQFVETGAIGERELEEIHAVMAWRNEHITLRSTEGYLTGVLRGIAPDGSLLLEREDEPDVTHLRVGEIARGPRPVRPSG